MFRIFVAFIILFSGALNARTTIKSYTSLTLEEAIEKGLKIEAESIVEIRVKKINFANFQPCTPISVEAQTFDKNGNVQMSANLQIENGWYEFHVNENHESNWRLSVKCNPETTTGLISYFIAPKRKLLPEI